MFMADIFELFRSIAKKEPTGAPTHLVVGLGNPGAEYALTRHNAGFLALDFIAQKCGVRLDRAKFRALFAHAEIAGVRVLLMQPQTYMNASGEAVRECAAFYKIPPENIIVISDDVNLPVGRLRVRRSGSDGGQKGLQSIIYQLNSDRFPRIRIGIGSPPENYGELADWVLGKLTESDRTAMFGLYEVIYGGIEKILSGDTDGAMQLCNSAGNDRLKGGE